MRRHYAKKVLTVVLTFFAAFPLAAQTYWDGSSSRDWTGSGTEGDPYLITTPQQLAGFAQAVNEGNDFTGQYLRLGADLYMSDTSAEHEAKPQWMPIGGIAIETLPDNGGWLFDTLRFCGHFDGAGHTVYNIYHSSVPDLSDWDDPFGSGSLDVTGWYRGFFGWIEDGSIKDLHLENLTMIGAADVGGLVMTNVGGTISGCSVSGMVVSANADVGGKAGGIAAANSMGIIENCFSSADVRGIRGVGCLVGENSGTVRDCHVAGKSHCVQYYVGGLAGFNAAAGLVTGSSSAGLVTRDAYSTAIEDCGGFAGANLGTIKECWSMADVESKMHGAGFCGLNGGRIESCYATGDVTISRFGCAAATFVGTNGRAPVYVGEPVPYEGICINCFATGKCQTEQEGTLYGFLSNYQENANRETLTVYCCTDADNYPYNNLGPNQGGVAPGIKGGAFRRSTAVMQSREFVDTLNMVAAVAGTSLWQYREGDYPVPTGQKADISLCFSSSGSGTEEDPFRLSSKQDLERFSMMVNLGWTFRGQHLLLENDIALNAPFEEWGMTAPSLWTPAGKFVTETTSAGGVEFEYEFQGTFDGGFHAVENMYLNTVADATPQGFFGIVNGATVKNLSVTDAWIKAGGAPGILAGKSSRYCMPTRILQCHTSGTVEGSWSSGGILGVISLEGSTNVINCSSSATLVPGEYSAHPVVGDQNYIGGTSYSNDTVANFIFTGSTGDAGIGYSKDISINCFYNSDLAEGNEEGNGASRAYMQSKEFVNVLNYYVAQHNERHPSCPIDFWQADEADYPSLPGAVPPHTVTYLTNSPQAYTPQPVLDDSRILPPPVPEQEGKLFYGWCTDPECTEIFAFDTTRITSSFNLYAKYQDELVPDFTPFTGNPFATTYIIRTPEQLLGFSRIVRGVEGVVDAMDFEGKTVKLGADILLNDTSGWQGWGDYAYARQWEPVCPSEGSFPFKGVFDGDGHTISGMYIKVDKSGDSYSRLGLFAHLRPDAVVRGVKMKASRIVCEPMYGEIGLLVACNRGIIDSCHVLSGEVEMTRGTAGLLAGLSVCADAGQTNGIGRILNSSATGNVRNLDATGGSVGGLVGHVGIRNDSIVNCFANASVISTGERAIYVGGLIGRLENGLVKDCSAMPDSLCGTSEIGGIAGITEGTVTWPAILQGCRAEGIIRSDADYVGGIVGRAEGKIADCHSSCDVVSEGSYVGGIAGYVMDSIVNSSSESRVAGRDYVGGMAGHSYIGCVRSHATGDVSGEAYVGGLAGSGGAFLHSYATGNVTGERNVGGLAGDGNTIADSYATGEVAGVRNVGGLAGISYRVDRSYAEGPVFGEGKVGGLSGTATFVDDSEAWGDVTATGDTVGGLAGWHQGWDISNSHAFGSVSGANKVGGFIGLSGASSGEVSRSSAAGDVEGKDYVGGFFGMVGSNVASFCYAAGDVEGHDYVGGFSGNGGAANCFARGSVTGNDYVGGFAGEGANRSTNSYSTGLVTAIGEHAGGFGVRKYSNYGKDSYYDRETSGCSDDAGFGSPRYTAYMKTKANYANWDFDANWGRKDTINDGYPYLRWMHDQFIEDDADADLPVLVTGISVSPTTMEITVGETRSITATVSPADASNQKVLWTSDDPDIATVSEDGAVLGVAVGTAVVTARTEDGDFSATCSVRVEPAPVIEVSRVTVGTVPTSLEVGEIVQLTATVEPEDAADKELVWSIYGGEGVVSLTPEGLLTGLQEGRERVTITATASNGVYGQTRSIIITVRAPAGAVAGVGLDYAQVTLREGDTWQLTATVEPAEAVNKTVYWESSDQAVATVDETGLVRAVGGGEAAITVRTEEGGFTAECQVIVEEAEDPVVEATSVRLSDTEIRLTEGESHHLTAMVEPENATDKTLSWESSQPSVADVDQDGNVMAYAEGYALVTVRTANNLSASCMVIVEAIPEPDMYELTITQPENGTITVRMDGEAVESGTGLEAGVELSLSAVADEGYRFVSWWDGNTSAERTYTMPAEPVTVSASFEDDVANETAGALAVTVYPNPSDGLFHVEVGSAMKAQVYTSAGRLLHTYDWDDAGKKEVDLQGRNAGTYYLRLIKGKQTEVIKLVVR